MRHRRAAALLGAVLFLAGAGSARPDIPTPRGKCVYTVCPTIDASGRIVSRTTVSCEQECPGASLPSSGSRRWRDVSDDIDTSRLVYEAARRNAEEFARVLSELSADQRNFAEGVLSQAERQSLDAALDALTQRLGGVVAANQSFQNRIAGLQAESSRLTAELLRLQEKHRALLGSTARLSDTVAEIEARIARTEARLVEVRADLQSAEAFAESAAAGAADARREYWSGMGKFFARHRLGSPRDYLPVIVPAAPKTLRRTFHRQEVLFPRALVAAPVAIPGAIAMPLFPAAPLAAAVAVRDGDVGRFRSNLANLQNAMGRTERLQREANALAETTRRSIERLDGEARSISGLEDRERELRFRQQEAAERDSRLTLEMQNLTSSVRAQIDSGLRGLREQAYWGLAAELLKSALSRSSAPGLMSHYALFMSQSFHDVLSVDMPKLIELMGPNPSDEALEYYEHLHSLDSHTARQLAMTMMFSGMDEVPSPRRARYKVVSTSGGAREFVSPEGLRMEWVPTKAHQVEVWRQKGNTVLHILDHSKATFDRLMRESPDFAHYIALKSNRAPHSLFDAGGAELFDLLNEAWGRRNLPGVIRLPPEHGTQVILIPMEREIGSILRWNKSVPDPGQRTRWIRFVVHEEERNLLITAHPYLPE